EPRTAQAVIYALVVCGACDGIAPRPRPRDVDDTAAAATRSVALPDPGPRVNTRAITIEMPPRRPEPARAEPPPVVSRSRTTTGSPATTPQLAAARRSSPFVVRDTIATGLGLIERGADHFALLGVPRDAPVDTIRSAYVAFACLLHPDKLPDLTAA